MNQEHSSHERESDEVSVAQPSDEYPGSFFRVPRAPRVDDSWSADTWSW